MGITKVGAVIWTTSRAPELLEFYTAIGIPLEPDTHGEPGGPTHYEADLAGVHFAVFNNKVKGVDPDVPVASMTIGLAVENIDETLRIVEKLGAKIRTPLQDTPWGKRIVVLDPDGRPVELYQPS